FSLDDKMNEMAAQVLDSGGDPVAYHQAKAQLKDLDAFVGDVKELAKNPTALKAAWPLLVKLHPSAAGLSPDMVSEDNSGIAIPLVVNGQIVPNKIVFTDSEGKKTIHDTTPKNDTKGFDTVDMGNRVKIVPRDGTAPYYEKKGVTPGAAAR